MSLNRLCLVINASYEAINVTSARRALTLVFKGAAVVEEVSAYTIRTSKINVPVPSATRATAPFQFPDGADLREKT